MTSEDFNRLESMQMKQAEIYCSKLPSDPSIGVVSREPRRSVCPIHAETHAYWIIAAGSDPFPPQPDFAIADRSLDSSDGWTFQ